MRFRFIDAERAGLAMPIFRLCRLLQVSVSGFYAWRNRGPSQRQLDDMVLLAHVRAAFRRSRESYGAERVHHELAENGIEVGRHGVARLMRGNGLSPKRKQKFKKTTDSQHNKAVASNLLDQNFSAEAPNEKWAADISYIWTAQGWLYLAVMPDLYSRRVIGWAVGARMTSVGTENAGAVMVAVGDNPDRLRSEASFAMMCGVCPIPASSGKTQRHRLNRGGNRQANSALHMVVVCRMRTDERTRAYVARRTLEGLSKREIMRCLKRYVAREIYRVLTAPSSA